MLGDLVNLFGQKPRALADAGFDDRWYVDIAKLIQTQSGVGVDSETALTYSAVWCATRVISESFATLPAVLFRRQGERKSKADNHPLWPILHDAPNPEQDAFMFYDSMTAWLVNWGNAYAEIQRLRNGRIFALWPIHPSRVEPRRGASDALGKVHGDQRLFYRVHMEAGPAVDIEADRMFHVTGAMSDGICGKGVIRQARESIGLGVATERFGAAFFGSGATPNGVISVPEVLNDEAASRMRRDWRRIHSNADNPHQIAVLEQGSKYQSISIPPEDAQFLETRQHNVTEIARWYRVPPHMLMDLTRATFSNIEQQSLDFVKQTMLPWARRWEKAIDRQLLRPGEVFSKFIMEGLLRGDTAARAQWYKEMHQLGVFSTNEIRELEDRNPIGPEGDKRLVQLNQTTLEKIGEEKQEAEPAPPPPASPPQQDEQSDEQMAAARRATWNCVAESLRRMLTKESNAATRAARKPREFMTWMDTFYAKHETLVAKGIEPACAVLGELGAEIDPAIEARQWCRKSYNELLEASECQPEDLEKRVTDTVERWQSRIEGATNAETED